MKAEHRIDADGPLDARDRELLALLRDCHESLDPMPTTLVDRTLFALALRDLDASLVQLAQEHRLEPVGARGGDASVITFEADDLTVMIRISPHGDTARIDGWLAPPGPTRVELRFAEGSSMTATADADGRFALDGIPHGPAHLVVRGGAPKTPDCGGTVLTPAIVL